MPKETIITVDLPAPMERYFHAENVGEMALAIVTKIGYSPLTDGWQFEDGNGVIADRGGVSHHSRMLFRIVFKEH